MRLFWQNLSCVEGESCETVGAPCIQSNFSDNYKVPDKINSSLKSNWIQFKCELNVSLLWCLENAETRRRDATVSVITAEFELSSV